MIATFFLFALVVPMSNSMGNGKIMNRILGGIQVNQPIPYQASIRSNGEHVCGGTIISSRHILTAAHCLISDHDQPPPYVFQVFLGATEKYSPYGDLYEVLRYDWHPGYVAQTHDHDIAVITLTREIIFRNTVQMIKPPQYQPPVGTIATASGYGAVDYRDGRATESDQLHELQMRIVSNDDCARSYPVIFSNQMCAFVDQGRGMCIGDSGGPLVVDGFLIGVVSYGIFCARNIPDVFIRVFDHLPWIKGILDSQARRRAFDNNWQEK